MSSTLPQEVLNDIPLHIDAAIHTQMTERQAILDRIEAQTCKFFQKGMCSKGNGCHLRHSRGLDGEVCKHWIRGLCKKGDECEYLHIYDMSKMPECQFFREHGQCGKGEECPFLHVGPDAKQNVCLWYARGFCRNGPNCKNQHIRREICPRYLAGFCPDGPNCGKAHPKFDLLSEEALIVQTNLQREKRREAMEAHMKIQQQQQQQQQQPPRAAFRSHPQAGQQGGQSQSHGGRREVTCHKCQQKGHYANACPNRRTF